MKPDKFISSKLPKFQDFRGKVPTYDQLIQEVGAWSDYNFLPRTHKPHLGILEEIGELAHCHLKAAQGIRGTKEEHAAATLDALADTGVFTLHYCYKHNFSPEPWALRISIPEGAADPIAKMIGNMASCAAQIILEAEETGGRAQFYTDSIVRYLEELTAHYAKTFGWKCGGFREVLWNTWKEVRQRDWRKYPKDGRTK